MCKSRVDLGFLIDSSGSIESQGRGNFKRILDFVKTLISFFPVSRRHTHVGVIIFSSQPVPIFRFSRYSTKAEVLKAVDRIRYMRGGTRIGKALRYAGRYFFRRRRRGRKPVLIVMTDGISQDRVRRPASQLKRRQVEIFSLGIGKRYKRRQLSEMATSPAHVLTVGFNSLSTVVTAIKQRACMPTVPSKYTLFSI